MFYYFTGLDKMFAIFFSVVSFISIIFILFVILKMAKHISKLEEDVSVAKKRIHQLEHKTRRMPLSGKI